MVENTNVRVFVNRFKNQCVVLGRNDEVLLAVARAGEFLGQWRHLHVRVEIDEWMAPLLLSRYNQDIINLRADCRVDIDMTHKQVPLAKDNGSKFVRPVAATTTTTTTANGHGANGKQSKSSNSDRIDFSAGGVLLISGSEVENVNTAVERVNSLLEVSFRIDNYCYYFN